MSVKCWWCTTRLYKFSLFLFHFISTTLINWDWSILTRTKNQVPSVWRPPFAKRRREKKKGGGGGREKREKKRMHGIPNKKNMFMSIYDLYLVGWKNLEHVKKTTTKKPFLTPQWHFVEQQNWHNCVKLNEGHHCAKFQKQRYSLHNYFLGKANILCLRLWSQADTFFLPLFTPKPGISYIISFFILFLNSLVLLTNVRWRESKALAWHIAAFIIHTNVAWIIIRVRS